MDQWIPPNKWNIEQPFSMFLIREIKQIQSGAFFWDTLYLPNYLSFTLGTTRLMLVCVYCVFGRAEKWNYILNYADVNYYDSIYIKRGLKKMKLSWVLFGYKGRKAPFNSKIFVVQFCSWYSKWMTWANAFSAKIVF